MRHLDLFSGIGGFALAARWAGLETIGFCEIDPFCQKVLAKNFPNIPIHGDVKTLNMHPLPYHKSVDLITAGFPCQPFSVAGKQKGKDDDRYLWPEVIRIIGECKPTWFIGENVPGIVPHLDTVLEDLESKGYSWETFFISASSVGAPHKRERVWIIANSNSERCDKRISDRQERHLQDNWQQHIEKIQSEWTQFQPESWSHFDFQTWFRHITYPISSEGRRQHSSFCEKESEQGALLGREVSGTINGFTANSNSEPSKERTENQGAESERFERQESERAIGDVIGNTDRLPDPQANSSDDTIRESGETWHQYSGEHRQCDAAFDWQKDQPPIPGVDDGLPNGLDRNKSLGNAIVPQIPYIFMKLIKVMHTLIPRNCV